MDHSRILEKNVGSIDRIVRVVIVAMLWGWPLIAGLGVLRTEIMGALGGIIFSTVITCYCPIWALFGISTVSNRLHST